MISYYIANKMSKVRNSRAAVLGRSRSRFRTEVTSSSKLHKIALPKLEGTHLYEQTRCHTIDSGHHLTRKETLYNKNISFFRQSFKLNDSHLLPFLASLRVIPSRKAKLAPTVFAPFSAEKITFNQKTKKSVNDVKANSFRLSKIDYRWNNASGAGVRAACQFQCGLRLANDCLNPEQSSFRNTISPIEFKTVQAYHYPLETLICPRQKRLFTLQNN